jgi:hypothetical protein
VYRWGWIRGIVTDDGPPVFAALEMLKEEQGITHVRVSGYNHRANGIVEAKHVDVREAIMKSCKGAESKWRHALPLVLWAERITIREVGGLLPFIWLMAFIRFFPLISPNARTWPLNNPLG